MLFVLACVGETPIDDSATLDDTGIAQVEGYGFDNASYSGQVLRQLLIDDTKLYLDGLTERIDNGEIYPAQGDIEADLAFYFEFDSSTSGSLTHGRSTDPATLQTTYDDISGDKDLVGKLAGNDATGQHEDWSTAFVGWDADGVTTPESLVRLWFTEIDALAADRTAGAIPLDPDGEPIASVFVSPEGRDYRQLLDKFLRGGIAYSQGTDDYLDDDVEGKGLLADHTTYEDGTDYSALEHAWDEGFGYFGAARTYGDWSDEEIKSPGYKDVDGDGFIDLTAEYNWGYSVNAAKRDLGSVSGTDYSAQAFESFVAGRALLSESSGRQLTADELEELRGHRDEAIDAWERSVSSTVVHYVNEVIVDTESIGSDDYSFEDHAKHWSEMKGFALSLQFNPRSQITDPDIAALHELVGIAPVLSDSPVEVREAYVADLLEARGLIADAYGFDPANLGDDSGQGGW